MRLFLKKLRLVGLPFMFCLLALLVVYTLYNWFLFIWLECITWDNMITNFVIPVGLSAILVYFYLRSTVQKLQFINDRKRDFFYFVLGAGLVIPTIMAQEYMDIATGKVTELNSIKDIDDAPVTKYYRLKRYYIDKKGAGFRFVTEVNGKHNENFNMSLYIAQPIFERNADTVLNATHHWFCTMFSKSISNRTTDKTSAINNFLDLSEHEYETTVADFSYLEHDSRSSFLKYYGNAASQSKLDRNGADIFLFPRQGAFLERTGNRLVWIFIMIGILSSMIMIFLYFVPLKTAIQVRTLKKKEARESAITWQERYEWIVPRDKFQTTPYIIFVLLGVYVAMVFSGCGFIQMEGKSLYDWGGLFRPAVITGEWWRVVTAMFLHGGIIHLLNNLLCFYLAGVVLESIIGSRKLLFLYLLCGIGASMASLLWNEGVLSVGASGAIFGLYGFMLSLKFFGAKLLKINLQFFFIAPLFIGINLFMGFITPAIDNAGHVGGLLAGLMLGAFYCLGLLTKKK